MGFAAAPARRAVVGRGRWALKASRRAWRAGSCFCWWVLEGREVVVVVRARRRRVRGVWGIIVCWWRFGKRMCRYGRSSGVEEYRFYG